MERVRTSPHDPNSASTLDRWSKCCVIIGSEGPQPLGDKGEILPMNKNNLLESRDPSLGLGRNIWSQRAEGWILGFNTMGTSDLGVVSTSTTYRSLDLGIGILSSLRGPGGLCSSSEGTRRVMLELWGLRGLSALAESRSLVASRCGAWSKCLETTNFGTSANLFPPSIKITPSPFAKTRNLVKLSGLDAVNSLETFQSSDFGDVGTLVTPQSSSFGVGMLVSLKGTRRVMLELQGSRKLSVCRIWHFRPFWTLTKIGRSPQSKLQNSKW